MRRGRAGPRILLARNLVVGGRLSRLRHDRLRDAAMTVVGGAKRVMSEPGHANAECKAALIRPKVLRFARADSTG